MKVYSFTCPSCGYESKHQLGTPGGDQILTDVNTEFAKYDLFVCNKEQKFVHANVLEADFDGKCPSDGTALGEVDPKEAKCPRCAGELTVDEVKPLATTDTATE